MQTAVALWTIGEPFDIREGEQESGTAVFICTGDTVQIEWYTEDEQCQTTLDMQGDKFSLWLAGVTRLRVQSPTNTYPFTVIIGVSRRPITVDSPHQGNGDLVTQLEASDAFQAASVYESTELILAADSAQSSAESYADVDSVQIAVTTAPTSAGYLTVADAGGKTFATFALITGLLNFVVSLPKPLVLKTKGLLQITSSVAVTVFVSLTGN